MRFVIPKLIAAAVLAALLAYPVSGYADSCTDLKDKAGQGDLAASRDLGHALLFGDTCFKADPKQSETWLLKAAASDDMLAQYYLGELYFTGALGDTDYVQAKGWYLKAGLQGHGLSQLRLGFLNAENHFKGLTTDYDEALKWFKLAAEQDAGDSRFRLGNFYHNYLTPPNFAEAFHWLSKAAEGGHRIAQFDLANFYRTGKGTAKDNDKALYWMEKAADNDVLHAQITLSEGYEKGEWLPKSREKAFLWAMKVASKPTASVFWTNRVADTLYTGDASAGVPKNYPLAFRMYSKGLRLNNEHALARLGIMYAEGRGTAQDLEKAKDYLTQAAGFGDAEAKEYLGKMQAP